MIQKPPCPHFDGSQREFVQRENRFEEVIKQHSMQMERKRSFSSQSRDALQDRFIPNRINCSHYSLLFKESNQNNRNSSKDSQSNRENSLSGTAATLSQSNSTSNLNHTNNSNSVNKDLNQSLREENSLLTYTSLLKYNILNEDQENFGILKPKFDKQEVTILQEKILKYKKINKRGSEMILQYSPFKIQPHPETIEAKQVRKIQKQPYKILDAPRLRDDFYYNLLDWSVKNIITIGLDNAIYTWSAKTNEAYKLAEYPNTQVTSLSWNPRGILLAAGDDNGDVRVFDTEKNKALRMIENHNYRVGTLCWNNNLLTTGSRDSKIFVTDLRSPRPYICKFFGHRQEVCGTKWSFDNDLLASGGNDNKVFVWSLKMQKELTRFSDHIAAVKALSWSPHQHHVLATGGGTTDKTLKFWNTNTLVCSNSIDTGSQICNMHFSKNSNEIVTTHGFSMNQVAVWQCDNFQKIATLYGHTYRVLYLAPSPDGESIVTGSGDETLRFWRIFPPGKRVNGEEFHKSNLDPYQIELR